ncbi:MAG: pyridoxamine 5'-phosphate oxidase family protein [Deltaproteobacteria bacterium]
MTREDLERIVIEFMNSFTTVNLACVQGEEPWAAAVYYARQGFDLIFFSSPGSRHSTAFSENARAAATIHGDYKGWREIKGLQMEGTVERIKGVRAQARALATYLKRYPFAREFLSHPSALSPSVALKMAKVALYRFRPTTILYMDNEQGFGTRRKLNIENGKAVGDADLG